jgi:3-hydroxyisobutyrate dehydrogenase-like beta-hydroxyacid dehydrogenase
MVEGDFTPEARLAQHRKDVALILEQARKHGQELPLSEEHLRLLDAAIAAGDGELDNSAVIRETKRRQTRS